MQNLAEAIRRGAVLLVCAAGMGRSPTMAAAWLHRSENLDFESAMRHISVPRPTIDPSPVLLRSVRRNLSRWGEQTQKEAGLLTNRAPSRLTKYARLEDS